MGEGAQPSKHVSAGTEKVNGAHGIGGVEKGRLQIAGLGSPAAPSGICLGNQSQVANHIWYYYGFGRSSSDVGPFSHMMRIYSHFLICSGDLPKPCWDLKVMGPLQLLCFAEILPI